MFIILAIEKAVYSTILISFYFQTKIGLKQISSFSLFYYKPKINLEISDLENKIKLSRKTYDYDQSVHRPMFFILCMTKWKQSIQKQSVRHWFWSLKYFKLDTLRV